MNKEIRMRTSKIEVRQQENEPTKIVGTVVRFNELSLPIGYGGQFREKIEVGAFAKSIESRNVKALWNHDTSKPLGNLRSGTLKLWESKEGLEVEVIPPDNTWGNDAIESLKRGDVEGYSFGFICTKDEWKEESDKTIIRTIKEAELFEISPCTFPCYEGNTNAQVRSIDQAYQHHIDTSQKDDDYIKNLQSKAQRSLFILQQKLNLKERI